MVLQMMNPPFFIFSIVILVMKGIIQVSAIRSEKNSNVLRPHHVVKTTVSHCCS